MNRLRRKSDKTGHSLFINIEDMLTSFLQNAGMQRMSIAAER